MVDTVLVFFDITNATMFMFIDLFSFFYLFYLFILFVLFIHFFLSFLMDENVSVHTTRMHTVTRTNTRRYTYTYIQRDTTFNHIRVYSCVYIHILFTYTGTYEHAEIIVQALEYWSLINDNAVMLQKDSH